MSRDYKDEYEKFQKDKSGYRANLNKYNRDKGTYGNGDGKDASHSKGGKITGFVASSTNKGKKEKSRLKGSIRKAQEGGKIMAEEKGTDTSGKYDLSEEHFRFLKNATLKQIKNYVKYNGDGAEFGPLNDKEVERQTIRWLKFNNIVKGPESETAVKVQKADGGKMVGPSHEQGGIDINVEGDEIIINKTKNNAAGIHEKDLLALNKNPDDYAIVNKSEFNWPSSDARERGE